MSVTAAAGFVAAGGACGIKADGAPDLAVVAVDDGTPVPAAGVFTSNRAAAAPVVVSRRHLEASGRRAAGVVINSGNANAATGGPGLDQASRMCELTAKSIGCATTHVLVCSTGLIGIPLPFDCLETGIPVVAQTRGPSEGDGARAAHAIMTTDTHTKQVKVTGPDFVIGGMAKGAAMLAPNMATMLAVLTTDAAVDGWQLQQAVHRAVASSFNSLSVDGCTSTNDTVLALASGRAGKVDADVFEDRMADACLDLATQMAGDAEGATKVVRVVVRGAASEGDAGRAARKVAESQLVKCSFYGRDPYWGRVVSELGSSGAAFEMGDVTVSYGGITVCAGGVAVPHDEAAVAAHMAGRDVLVEADLGLGDGQATILTNDLTHAYIDENMGTS